MYVESTAHVPTSVTPSKLPATALPTEPSDEAARDAFANVVDYALEKDDTAWPREISLRLRSVADKWKSIATPTVQRWIEDGIRLIWEVEGPPARSMRTRNGKGATMFAGWLRDELKTFEAEGVVRRVDIRPNNVMPINVLEKQKGGFRFLLDCRDVNDSLKPYKFKMETIARSRSVFERGAWMTTLDLKSGYYHARVNDLFTTYLGFEFEGQYYEHVALPMGLRSSASAFSKIVRQLVLQWRAQGIVLAHYLDDLATVGWQNRPHSREATEEATAIMINDLEAYGFLINKAKSHIVPLQRIEFLGFVIDTSGARTTIAVTERRKDKAMTIINDLVDAQKTGAKVLVRDLAKFAGTVMSMSLAVGPAVHRRSRAAYAAIERRSHWNAFIDIYAYEAMELQFWQGLIPLLVPIMLIPDSIEDCNPLILRVDASATAMGAWLAEHDAAATGGAAYEALRSACSEEAAASLAASGTAAIAWEMMLPHVALKPDGTPTASTYREVWGVLHALRSLAERAQDRALIVFCDNQAAETILTKGSSLLYINELVVEVHELLARRGITAEFRWQPREDMEAADRISKWDGEWRLSAAAMTRLRGFYDIEFDVFASETAHHGLPYFGPAASPSCDLEHVDAFARAWPRKGCLVFPPPRLIDRAITHMRASKAKGVLIVPEMINQSWSQRVQGMYSTFDTRLTTGRSVTWHGAHDPTQQIRSWRVLRV